MRVSSHAFPRSRARRKRTGFQNWDPHHPASEKVVAARLPAVAFPDSRHSLGANGDQPAGLGKHHFSDGCGDLLTEQAETPAVMMVTVRPLGKFIRRRRVTDIRRAASHDETEHHLRVGVS